MKKIFFEGFLLIIVFLSSLLILNQIDWMKLLQVEENTKATEEKLGEIFYDFVKSTNKEITDPLIVLSIDTLLQHICSANDIDSQNIKIHILENEKINAFALPDGHLIIFSALIEKTENESELSGILCHEIAHIELNHVMKRLVKEVGLTMLISIAGGNTGSDMINESVRYLSSTAYDRVLEKEADLKAVDYLIKADISPVYFANFFYTLEEPHELKDEFSWLSTHPDLQSRAEYIVEYYQYQEYEQKNILSLNTWDLVRENIQ